MIRLTQVEPIGSHKAYAFGCSHGHLGIKPSEMCDLQRGRVVPTDGWEAVWTALGRRP